MSDAKDQVNSLMLHVESIVRPVRAREARKLKMRRELLAHLQAAHEEERGTGETGEAALERAKRRLGESAALTRSLQQSVPAIERIWFAQVWFPGERALTRWHRARGRLRISEMQLLFLILMAWLVTWSACSVAVPLSKEAVVAFFGMEHEHRARFLAVFVFLWVMTALALPLASYRMAASPLEEKGMLRRGVAAVGLLMAWTVVMITQVGGHGPTWLEMCRALAAGIGMVLLLGFLGRWAARWRSPYVEWLELQVADQV